MYIATYIFTVFLSQCPHHLKSCCNDQFTCQSLSQQKSTGPDTALFMVKSLPCLWDLINIPLSTLTEKLRGRGYGRVLLRDQVLPQGFDSECPLSCSEFFKSTDCSREAGNCRLLIPRVSPLLVWSFTLFWALIKHIVIHTLFLVHRRKKIKEKILNCPPPFFLFLILTSSEKNL